MGARAVKTLINLLASVSKEWLSYYTSTTHYNTVEKESSHVGTRLDVPESALQDNTYFVCIGIPEATDDGLNFKLLKTQDKESDQSLLLDLIGLNKCPIFDWPIEHQTETRQLFVFKHERFTNNPYFLNTSFFNVHRKSQHRYDRRDYLCHTRYRYYINRYKVRQEVAHVYGISNAETALEHGPIETTEKNFRDCSEIPVISRDGPTADMYNTLVSIMEQPLS
ncbi:hypothetical protein SCOR_33995 [Sulfidibacter corallicola]|uniref:Uncharacterized protein n=1 Tax=Sulfidibacter corallicola TaxID=2818388 RepID=A0A8A4TKN9_SULCO|nr:hypothetical protein [Sulfidibacter corallicola]QTD49451.1 hypothetical protein J3U87_28020 [Sulfidibacter corallicola]